MIVVAVVRVVRGRSTRAAAVVAGLVSCCHEEGGLFRVMVSRGGSGRGGGDDVGGGRAEYADKRVRGTKKENEMGTC